MNSALPLAAPVRNRPGILEHTFIHLPGVGLATETRWWQQGILTWTQLLQRLSTLVRGVEWRSKYQHILEASLVQRDDPRFFAEPHRATLTG